MVSTIDEAAQSLAQKSAKNRDQEPTRSSLASRIDRKLGGPWKSLVRGATRREGSRIRVDPAHNPIQADHEIAVDRPKAFFPLPHTVPPDGPFIVQDCSQHRRAISMPTNAGGDPETGVSPFLDLNIRLVHSVLQSTFCKIADR
jgi:hypothetical protein